MDRGTWWATVHGVTKELDVIQRLNNNNPTWVLSFVWFPQIHEFSVCAFACETTSTEALSTLYLPAQAAPVQDSVSLSSAKVSLNCAPTDLPAHFSQSTYFIILLSFV